MIVMLAPQRHDLMPSSCVNSEVFRFNRIVRKLYTKTKILDSDLNRDCFTKHGLHMNYLGKDQLIMKLAGMIESGACGGVRKEMRPVCWYRRHSFNCGHVVLWKEQTFISGIAWPEGMTDHHLLVMLHFLIRFLSWLLLYTCYMT